MKKESKIIIIITILLIAGLVVIQPNSSIKTSGIDTPLYIFKIRTNIEHCTVTMTAVSFNRFVDVSLPAQTVDSGKYNSWYSGMSEWTTGADFYLPQYPYYNIVVSKPGYHTFNFITSVPDLYGNYYMNIHLFKKPIPASNPPPTSEPTPPKPTYNYIVKTNPIDCSVKIGNTIKDTGENGAIFNLTAGDYVVSVSKSGYLTNNYSVTVSSEKIDIVTLAVAYSYIVMTHPYRCTVEVKGNSLELIQNSGNRWIDQSDWQRLPGACFSLSKGEYVVTISKEGYNSTTFVVNIAEDKIDAISLISPPESIFVSESPTSKINIVIFVIGISLVILCSFAFFNKYILKRLRR